MSKLILIRHGQSEWNLQNRFTGWVDVELSPKGFEEAQDAIDLLKDIEIDYVFTSVLKRAIHTAAIILEKIDPEEKIPIFRSKALNERHYGDLQGLNKAEVGEEHGNEQLHIWRRSFDIPPPNGESLKDTMDRVLPYYKEKIEPLLKDGKNVLISAHGNSLRGLMMYLEDISKDKITSLNIPTGKPYVYDFDDKFNIINHEYIKY